MALHYENLDHKTRQFMLQEMELDVSRGTLYISPRLNEKGASNYESLLRQTVEKYDDAWLANELRRRGFLKAFERRRKFTTAKVPVNAPDTLAEGEFNRLYVRGLCLRAIEENIAEAEVYRGKSVKRPRPESVAMIGRKISAQDLLEDLRDSPGVEPALRLPPGPNSGLTVRLP